MVIAIPVLLLLVSGLSLLLSEQIVSLRLPALGAAVSPTAAEDLSRDLSRIESLSADAGWDVIRLPQPGWPVYHLWLKSGEQAYFLPGADSFLDRFLPLQRPESFLYELHAHLLAGKLGKELVRILSVVLLVMATLGLFLWWPYRSRFRVADALPRRALRMHLTRSHMTLAILVAPFLFFTLAVAWAMAYPDAARAALGGVFGQSRLMDQRVVVSDQGDRFNWLRIIRSAQGVYPDDQLVYLIRPARADQPLKIRTRLASEWHPNGRSVILLRSDTGEVLMTEDATRLGLDQRIANAVYPVHSARGGGVGFMPVSIISASGLAALAVLGFWSFIKGRRRLEAGRRVRSTG